MNRALHSLSLFDCVVVIDNCLMLYCDRQLSKVVLC